MKIFLYSVIFSISATINPKANSIAKDSLAVLDQNVFFVMQLKFIPLILVPSSALQKRRYSLSMLFLESAAYNLTP